MRTLQRYCSALPTRSNTRSCSTRSSLTCIGRLMSPISSRNSVPPSASSKRPLRVATAPVKAPFSWPNSSLSSRSAGMAPQFTAMNGRLRRGLALWMARATTSLPVPDSPRISTLESCTATWRISAWICRMVGESPVGPCRMRRSSCTSRSAVAIGLVLTLINRQGGIVTAWRRQKSDAMRQLSERACDSGLTSGTTRLANAGHMAPVTAERQLFDEVGGRLAGRLHRRLHQPVIQDVRDVDGQAERLGQTVAQPDLQHPMCPDTHGLQRFPLRICAH